MQGEDLLKQFYEETYQKELIKISDRIYFFIAMDIVMLLQSLEIVL